MPEGVRPYMVGGMFRNRKTGKEVWADFYGRTWRNAANAQHHRRCLYFNILPRVNGPQLYAMYVAQDDWNHGTITRRIDRARAKVAGEEHGWLGFDNFLKRGYALYLTSIPGVSGFEPVEGDIEPILIDALKALSPPDKGVEGRYHGYWGSDNWTKKAEIADEEDQDVCDMLAVSNRPTDRTQVEAECRVNGSQCKEIRPYWKSQIDRALETNMGDENAVRLALYMNYRPTKHSREVLAASNPGNSVGEEWVKGFAGTLDPLAPEAWAWEDEDEIVEGVL